MLTRPFAIMDYGKISLYGRKRAKSGRKTKVNYFKESKCVEYRRTRLSVQSKTGAKFLQDDNRVKVTVMFRGERNEICGARAEELLDRVISETKESAKVERKPKLEGRNMTLILISNKSN